MSRKLTFAECRELARLVREADRAKEAIASARPKTGVTAFRSRAPLAFAVYVADRDNLLAYDPNVGFALLRPHGRANRRIWQDGVGRGVLRLVDRNWDGIALLGPAAIILLLSATLGIAGVLVAQAWLLWGAILAGIASMLWVAGFMAAGLLATVYRGLRVRRTTLPTFAETTLPSWTWSVPLLHVTDPSRADRMVALVRTHVWRCVGQLSSEAAADVDGRITGVATMASIMIHRRGITTGQARDVVVAAAGRQPVAGSDVLLIDPPDRDANAVPPVVPATFFFWYAGGSAVVLAIVALIVATIERAACGSTTCPGRPATYPDALRWIAQRLWFQDPPGLTPATAEGTIMGWLASAVMATGVAVAVVSLIQLGRRHRFLQDRLRQMRAGMQVPPELVILTAIETEFVAVREHLTDVHERDIHGTLFDVGTYYGRHHVWTVAVGQIGGGGESAALQVERVRTAFAPSYVVFCGVAGGRKDVRRGDVVAADVVYDYESSKEEADGIRTRFKTYHSSDNLVQRAMAVARAGEWRRTIRPDQRAPVEPEAGGATQRPAPRAFVKPLAAGAKLLTSQRANSAQIITERAGDALAVELEGFGFLHGAHISPGISAIVIRGISDLLDGKDEANDEYWQPIAARNAAAFAFAMFQNVRPR